MESAGTRPGPRQPKPYTLNAKLSLAARDWVRAEADRSGLTVSSLIDRILIYCADNDVRVDISVSGLPPQGGAMRA